MELILQLLTVMLLLATSSAYQDHPQQPSNPWSHSPFPTHPTFAHPPPFDSHSLDHYHPYGSPHPFHGQAHGLLFTCDGLPAGFYADYNDCRYFHLCHQANPRFHNPLNQLAITTYVCPESTYFNQRRLACTRLEEFETSCTEQVHLFRPGVKKVANPGKSDAEKTTPEQRLAEKRIEDQQRLVEILMGIMNADNKMNITDAIYKKLVDSKNDANQKQIDEFSSKLAPGETNDASTISPLVNPNLENIVNGENVTESPRVGDSVDSMLAGADKKDEKESSDLIEITFSCEGRPYGYFVDISHDCRVFHVCQPVEDPNGQATAFMNSFRCPEDLVFNQATLTCTNTKDLTVPCYAQEMFFSNVQPNNQLLPEPPEALVATEATEKDEIPTIAPLD